MVKAISNCAYKVLRHNANHDHNYDTAFNLLIKASSTRGHAGFTVVCNVDNVSLRRAHSSYI